MVLIFANAALLRSGRSSRYFSTCIDSHVPGARHRDESKIVLAHIRAQLHGGQNGTATSRLQGGVVAPRARARCGAQ